MLTIIGHQKIIDLLLSEIRTGTVAPVYIFSGPSHVGKGTVARFFAQQLATRDADIVFLSPEADSSDISINSVRQFLQKIDLTPLGDTIVGIIDDADQLTSSAGNALLKTLEDHHTRCTVLIICHRLDAVPHTIISRARHVRFQRVTPHTLSQALHQQQGIPLTESRSLTEIAAGRPGIALTLSAQPEHRERYRAMIEGFLSACTRHPEARLSHVSEIKDRAAVQSLLDIWVVLARDILLLHTKNVDRIEHVSFRRELSDIASNTQVQQWSGWIQHTNILNASLKGGTAQPLIVRDAALLTLPSSSL